MDIQKCVLQEKEELISWRRHFHEYPEGSQQEYKTMDFIEELLHTWQIPTVRVPHGGIIGIIDSGKPGYTVLMRADMDALPIQESPVNLKKDKVCVSKHEGFSHACGHDGHMAMLLGEAKILATHTAEWEGKVMVVFEEAEEFGERGIGYLMRYITEQGIHIDTCYATHVRWDIPAGKLAVLDDGVMSGTFFFRVKIHGKGGHGSRPDLSVNPIDAFLSFSNALQSFRMRHVDPTHCLTYSFGAIQAGREPNIIPEELTFAGTCRFFTNEDGNVFRKKFYQLLTNECENVGCTFEMMEEQCFPVTCNDTICAALARKGITEQLGSGVLADAEPWMASETYSIYISMYPGILAFTGIKDEEVGCGANHHTPQFDIGEDGLVTGVAGALAYVLAILKEKPDLSHFTPGNLDEMLALV